MIPLRIYIKGFLSYRDEAELTFDGAPLWVLTGRNGSGKSALFDAITFALYRLHRGGRSSFDDLINHDAEELLVQFDFGLGEDIYRAERTVAKNKGSTRQIYHLRGPHAPYPGKEGCQPVPETDSEKGFQRWVEEYIGLDEETFTASVLLRQGDSEAMLRADPADRHSMLKRLVDLSAYERLEERATEKKKQSKTKAELKKIDLAQLDPVDGTEIAQLTEQINRQTGELGDVEVRLGALQALKVHAGNWERLVGERKELTTALEEAAELLQQAAQIEADAARLEELNQVLPVLRQILQQRTRLEDCRKQIATEEGLAAELQRSLDELEPRVESAKNHLDELQSEQWGCEQNHKLALQTLQKHAGNIADLEEMRRLRGAVAELEEQLGAFAPSLDSDVDALSLQIEQLKQMEQALPWLRVVARERELWHAAIQEETTTSEWLSAIQDDLTVTKEKREALETLRDGADDELQVKQRAETEAATLLQQAQAALKRFDEVEGQTRCHYCGQELTNEHLEKELARLEEELRKAKGAHQKAQREVRKADKAQKEAVQAVKDAEKRERELEEAKHQFEGQQREAQQTQARAFEQVKHAIGNLSVTYQARIQAVDGDTLLVEGYPAEADMTEMAGQVNQLNQRKKELEGLAAQQQERNKLQTVKRTHNDRLEQVEEEYPAERVEEINNVIREANEAQGSAETRLVSLAAELKGSEARYNSLKTECEAMRSKLEQANRLAQSERAREGELQQTINDARERLPEAWQPLARSFTDDELQGWEGKAQVLAGADERREALHRTRQQQERQQALLNQTLKELGNIPDEARRPLEELTSEEQKALACREELKPVLDMAKQQKRELVARQKRRAEVEKEYKEASREASLHGELARYLGRNFLQRDLLQQAEAAIVDSANEILNRISGGTLWLELRSADGDSGKTKALDIVAFNSETGSLPRPIPVAYLSGSQRFRVAVSLALGIGRYASRGMQRIDAVIIDEGFGGLDREGRAQMIDELHELKQELQRIILVSHQEEFASAFHSNVYEVALVDGTSAATLRA